MRCQYNTISHWRGFSVRGFTETLEREGKKLGLENGRFKSQKHTWSDLIFPCNMR